MSGDTPPSPPPEMLATIANLSEHHREHEKFYAQAPLWTAAEPQAASRALKALAGRWSEVEPTDHPAASPLAGAEDLNPLYSASELIDRAADLIAESATLVHENERRWRVFSERVRELRSFADG